MPGPERDLYVNADLLWYKHCHQTRLLTHT